MSKNQQTNKSQSKYKHDFFRRKILRPVKITCSDIDWSQAQRQRTLRSQLHLHIKIWFIFLLNVCSKKTSPGLLVSGQLVENQHFTLYKREILKKSFVINQNVLNINKIGWENKKLKLKFHNYYLKFCSLTKFEAIFIILGSIDSYKKTIGNILMYKPFFDFIIYLKNCSATNSSDSKKATYNRHIRRRCR